MDTFEIKDDEINVEEIMSKIRENIKKRRESGVYETGMEEVINRPLFSTNKNADEAGLNTKSDITHDLDFLNSCWNIYADYNINSHRPIIGPLLVSSRKVVHGEVKRYVDLVVNKQNEFNLHLVNVLNGLCNKIAELDNRIGQIDNKIDGIDTKFNTRIDGIDTKLIIQIDEVKEIKKEIEKIIEKLEILKQVNSGTSIDKNIKSVLFSMSDEINKIKNEIDTNLDIDYSKFKERFSGDPEFIERKQKCYLNYFEKGQVLDIGCGSGELLGLLKNKGIEVKGIDINDEIVNICINKGLDVRKADAFEYLRSIPDSSLGGIFMSQVAEHFKLKYLLSVIKEAFRKLEPDGTIIIETVNPTSFFSHSNFYLDPTHIQILHPEALKFLLESSGFKNIQIEYTTYLSENKKLNKIDASNDLSEFELKLSTALNENFDKLNSILFGPHDFAVIAKK